MYRKKEELLGKEIKVLDKGFVKLVDYMGSDDLIVNAARISYDFKGKSKDEALIDYLMRNEHMSPFEMVEFVFHIKVPIFVARQIFRHRTASFNEISGRYTEIKDEFFYPSEFRANKGPNKQMSVSLENDISIVNEIFDSSYKFVYENYKNLINNGLARELSRSILPLGTYTMFFYKQDLRNLLNFIRLRIDEHAQKEVREVANAIVFFVKEIVPITWKAFENNVLCSVKFTKDELSALSLKEIRVNEEKITSKTKLEELKKKIEKVKRLIEEDTGC